MISNISLDLSRQNWAINPNLKECPLILTLSSLMIKFFTSTRKKEEKNSEASLGRQSQVKIVLKLTNIL